MVHTDKPLLAAIAGCALKRPPFWLMRQAGRYLPEYRVIREKAGSFLALCQDPELAAEVTLQPLRRFNMDAAIVFSDILLIPAALGQDLTFTDGEGPKLNPIKSPAQIERLSRDRNTRWLKPVYQALQKVRSDLASDKALIGFAGAPWTLAAYMVEGGSSATFRHVTEWAIQDPLSFDRLIGLLTNAVTEHLSAQIASGADLVQIFDSWAGVLTGDAFDRYVIAPIREITTNIKQRHPNVPVIAFPRGSGARYDGFARATGVDVVSVDYSIPVDHCRDILQTASVVQGLLSPELLVEGGYKMRRAVEEMLEKLGPNGYIFNLGHGVLPQTPVENVAELADMILLGR
jgi:uroporphyrinogen decarboxylase